MMTQLSEEVDYLKIEGEFNNVQDYRDFILQYNKVKNLDVQYLIVKAHWLLLLGEDDVHQQKASLIGFIRKYHAATEDRIKVIVAKAMFVKLKLEADELKGDELLEECNNLVDYTYDIHEPSVEVYQALVFSYWHKAQAIRKKDWRKAQHFYNQVSDLCSRINDNEHELYKIKAQIAKVTLHLQYGYSDHIDKLFYKAVNKFVPHTNSVVVDLLDDMIDLYIRYLVSEDEWFYQAEQSKVFVNYLSDQPNVKKIILDSLTPKRATPRLLWIAYVHWGNKEALLCEQYLLRYFAFTSEWSDALNNFKEYLQFDTVKDRKAFLEYAEDLYKRHINLEKYRKLFRSDRSK